MLQVLIRTLTTLVHRISAESVSLNEEQISRLADPLVATLHHESADVRKSVVFCFVEFHELLGEDRFRPILRS